MKPVLFHLGALPIPGYGVMAVLAFCACYVMVRHFSRLEGWRSSTLVDAIAYSAFAGFFSAKALYLLVSWGEIVRHPRPFLLVLTSGGVYLGGLIGGIAFGVWWFRRQRIPGAMALDILALTGALGIGIARWGCFLSGCCHGRPTELPWAVTFPETARALHAGLPAVPVHPTQVYLSLNSLAIFALLAWFYRRKRFHGAVAGLYLVLYGFTRFFIEFARGDEIRGHVFGGVLSTSQLISLAVIAAGAALYLLLARRHRLSGAPDWTPAPAPSPAPAGRGPRRGGKPSGRRRRRAVARAG